jgi:KaiC/GvpD/RAD55 family RecA-like ATPase
MADEYFSESQQESLLTLLMFNEEQGSYLASFVLAEHFEGVYRRIAQRVLEYLSSYGKVPGAHANEILEDLVDRSDEGQRIKHIYNELFVLRKRIHPEFVVRRAADFVRRQTYKAAITKAALCYQEGGESITDDVERILLDALKLQTNAFDPGLNMGDVTKSLEYMTLVADSSQVLKLGIPPLDDLMLGPTRREMLLFMASRKRGKTWMVIHCAKQAIMQGWRVLHVSLEVNRHRMAQRYHQAFFAIAKRPVSRDQAVFKRYDDGTLENWDKEHYIAERSYFDESGRLHASMSNVIRDEVQDSPFDFNRLRLMDFPSGKLTMQRLTSYLDLLERREKFKPDLLIVDYPDLMAFDRRDPLHGIDQVMIELRGLADERDMALVVPTQTNRASIRASEVREEHTAENISKVATADTVITYTQSEEENSFGVARLFVSNARNEEDRFTVSLVQNYATGQFALDSMRDPKHEEHLKAIVESGWADE